jgi:membrane-associated phospholipid phosphatase
LDFSALRTVLVAFLLMTLSSYAVYLLLPTYVVRPDPTGSGWALDLIRWLYGNDQPYNALPSGHTYNTVIIMLILWDWKPRLRWLWVLSVLIVILSTLFTRQHYILDVIFGAIWAFGFFALARKLSGWPWQNQRYLQPT